jgi:hypothetical protein
MAFRSGNRAKVTATSTGSGPLTLGAALTGFQLFDAIPGMTTGDTVPYTAWNGVAEWECGLGTYNTTTKVLTRTTIFESSTGSAVAFTSVPTVWCDLPASYAVSLSGLFATAAIGDIPYASATTPSWSKLAAVAVGAVLVSAGVGVAPAWSTSPSLTSLAVSGAVTAGTLNGLTVTSSTGTLTVANGKTLTANNSVALSGTDGTVMTFPATSATIARTDAANTFTGTQTIGALVATTINGNTFTAGTGVLTIATGKTLSISNSITLAGTDATTITFQGTDTYVGRATTDTLTNKSINLSNNTMTNFTLAMGATNVFDTDATLAANSATRVATQSAIKSYVDNAITGLTWKPAVVCATTANITLSGEQTIDGVTTSASRVLVKNQSTGSQNGLYLSGSGAWTRVTDADTGAEIWGCAVFVEAGGTTNADTQWVNSNATLPVIGTTAITFSQIAGAGTYSATGGITLTGNQFAITTAGITNAMLAGSISNANLANSSVTLGSTAMSLGSTYTTIAGAITWSGSQTFSSAMVYGGVTLSNSVTGTGSMVLSAGPTFTGTLSSANHTITSASAASLVIGLNGATNPAFTVDSSTALQVAGFKVTGAVTGGTVALVATDSGANTSLTINAKGTGTIGIGSVSTGAVTITPATTHSSTTTLSGALTYGGVTLSNSVTGTGSMVLSASPTLTGTTTMGTTNITTSGATVLTVTSSGTGNGVTINFPNGTGTAASIVNTGLSTMDFNYNGVKFMDYNGATTVIEVNNAIKYGSVTLSNAVTGTGNMVLSASPTLTGTLTAAAANFSGAVSSATEFKLAQTYLRVATVGDAFGWVFGGGYNFAFNSGVGWKHDGTGALSGVAYNNAGSIGFFAAGSQVAGTAAAQVATFASNLLTLSQPLNYGGVTLSNSVTGTGSMVLSASPTLTGTLTGAAATFSGAMTGTTLALTKASGGDALTWTNGGATPKTGYLYSDSGVVAMFNVAGAGAGRNGIQISSTAVILDINAGTNTANFTASGLGINVTPSAWSFVTGLQTGLGGSFVGNTAASTAYVISNAYYNGSAWKAINTGTSCSVQLDNVGQCLWSTAASVSAGSTVSFAEKMRLDASGRLGIGMTPSNILDITQSTTGNAIINLLNSNAGTAATAGLWIGNGTNSSYFIMQGASYTTSGIVRQNGLRIQSDGAGGLTLNTGAAQPIYFGINNTEYMRLNTSGRLTIGTAYDAGASYSITTNAGVMGLGTVAGGNGSASLSTSGVYDVTSNGLTTTGYGESTNVSISNVQYTYGGFAGFVHASDAMVKTVLADRINYRDAIANLFIGDFIQYKGTDKTGIPHAGFGVLAQQAHAVLGEFVGIQQPLDEYGLWSATQEPWAFLALKGVKSALSEIDQLRLDLSAARDRISVLEAA